MEYSEIINSWIQSVIVGLNLCPYAKKPFASNALEINICESDEFEQMFNAVIGEIDKLNSSTFLETSIVAYPKSQLSFQDFYDFTLDIQDSLEEVNLLKDYQVVCFHPEFHFDGSEKEQRVNYVNRSPFALIHILKSQSIENLNLSSSEAEEISYKNEKTLNELSQVEFNEKFNYLKNK